MAHSKSMCPTTIYRRLLFSAQQGLHYSYKKYFISMFRMADKCQYPGQNDWKKSFLRPYKLNTSSVRPVDHSPNLISCNLWMYKTFGFCYKILPLIDLIYIVHKNEVYRSFLIDLFINHVCYAFPINHQTWYDIIQ